MLRQQIHKQKNGGGGDKPPGGRGGGGGGPGGSEEGDFAGLSDEIQQIILATIGFILVVLSFSLLSVFYISASMSNEFSH